MTVSKKTVSTSSKKGIRWAPIRTPIKRRRQTASVLLWIFLMPFCALLFIVLLLTVHSITPFLLAYGVYAMLDPSPECGGRVSNWMRSLTLWTWVRDYFPMALVKTAELPPTKRYIFGYHPHGVVALGAFINFGSEANGFSKLFEGIRLSVLTLGTNFKMPFWRELLLSMGFCSVSKRSCENILSQGNGRSLMIVVGGASEAIYAYPGTYDLVLKRRYGFIKLAIRYGAALVPVIAFGENDIWDQVSNPEGSLVRKFQKVFQRIMAFTPIFFHGRGVFQYDIGILPFRRPVTTVVGAPIEVPLISNPDSETIEKFHKIYVDALIALFDAHKEKYATQRKREMAIVE